MNGITPGPVPGAPVRVSREAAVFRGLRDDILTGRYAPGVKLPTMMAIAESYGASETAAQKAAARLRSMGLVRTEPGRGAWVVDAITDRARMRGVLAALRDGQTPADLFGPDAGPLVAFPASWLERLLDTPGGGGV